jgi:hypothetical protein
MYAINQQQNTGSFVPTTNVWDVNEIYALEELSDDFKDLLVRLYQNLNLMATVLNTKDSAYYLTQQFMSGQLYYNPATNDPLQLRPGFRTTIDTGALAAGTTTVAHNINGATGITANYTWFFVNGAATNSTTPLGVPLPYVGTTGTDNISISVGKFDINIVNNSGLTFDRSSVTLEFVQN